MGAMDKMLEWVRGLRGKTEFIEPANRTTVLGNISAIPPAPAQLKLPYQLFDRLGKGSCHGCHHFKGDGPLDKRYRPAGECQLATNKPMNRSVSWNTPACRMYSGWGMWCDYCGSAMDFSVSLTCKCRVKFNFK